MGWGAAGRSSTCRGGVAALDGDGAQVVMPRWAAGLRVREGSGCRISQARCGRTECQHHPQGTGGGTSPRDRTPPNPPCDEAPAGIPPRGCPRPPRGCRPARPHPRRPRPEHPRRGVRSPRPAGKEGRAGPVRLRLPPQALPRCTVPAPGPPPALPAPSAPSRPGRAERSRAASGGAPRAQQFPPSRGRRPPRPGDPRGTPRHREEAARRSRRRWAEAAPGAARSCPDPAVLPLPAMERSGGAEPRLLPAGRSRPILRPRERSRPAAAGQRPLR